MYKYEYEYINSLTLTAAEVIVKPFLKENMDIYQGC